MKKKKSPELHEAIIKLCTLLAGSQGSNISDSLAQTSQKMMGSGPGSGILHVKTHHSIFSGIRGQTTFQPVAYHHYQTPARGYTYPTQIFSKAISEAQQQNYNV